MAYFNQVTRPKRLVVNSIVHRPKGIILCTQDYDCFIFKDNKVSIGIIELLNYFEIHESEQRELWIQPNKDTKLGFDIQIGEPTKWYFYESKTSTTPESVEEEIDFIKDLKALNNLPFPTTDEGSTRSKAKKNGSTR